MFEEVSWIFAQIYPIVLFPVFQPNLVQLSECVPLPQKFNVFVFEKRFESGKYFIKDECFKTILYTIENKQIFIDLYLMTQID